MQIADCNGASTQKFHVNEGSPIAGPGGQCVDVAGDDTGVNGAAVQMWNCQSWAKDQHWTHWPDNALTTLGRCLDITGNGTWNGAQVELWDCTGGSNQKWVQQSDGTLLNPQSGRCLDDSGSTNNGTRLTIWDCSGSNANQKFALS